MFTRSKNISNIAKNLKEYRIKKNMKQTEMAELLKMNYQNYSKMERGAYQPSLEKVLEICDILYLTPNDLLLEGRDFDDWKKESLEKMDSSVINILKDMQIIGEQLAKASVAHDLGRYDDEKFYLIPVMEMFIKEGDKNVSYRKALDVLYYEHIRSYVNSYSEKLQKELYEKVLTDILNEK